MNWINNDSLRHSYNCKIKEKEMNDHLEIKVTLIILYIKPTFQLRKMILMIRHTYIYDKLKLEIYILQPPTII